MKEWQLKKISQNIKIDKHKKKKHLYKQYGNKMSLAFDVTLASVKRTLVYTLAE